MKKLFLAASGLFALVPGLAIMWKAIGTPPGYETLFGGVIEAFGALAFLILWVNQEKLQGVSKARITKAAILLGVGSLFSLILYLALFNFCVVGDEIRHWVYYPLWTSGEIEEIISEAGNSRYKALQENGFAAIYRAIREMPNYPLAITITTGLLLLVYQAIFTSLCVAFGVLGFHKGEGFPDAGARDDVSPPSSVASNEAQDGKLSSSILSVVVNPRRKAVTADTILSSTSYLIVFTGPGGLAGNFTGAFNLDITSAMPRSSCGSRPSISNFGSLVTSMSGSTP